MLHIKLKRITNAATWLPTDPSPDPWYRISRSNFFFSEPSHVAYQIKENQECSNMVVFFLPAGPGGLGGCGQNICNHVAAFMILFNVICKMTMF